MKDRPSEFLLQEYQEIRTSYPTRLIVVVMTLLSVGCQTEDHKVNDLGQNLVFSETNSLGMEFRLIRPDHDPRTTSVSNKSDESTSADIDFRPIYFGIHEVTIAQFRAFVEATEHLTDAESDEIRGGVGLVNKVPTQDTPFSWRETGFPQSDQHPVVNVSWNDAQAFVEWLSEKEARHYRLPTEAEWEYACLAGAKTAFSHGDDPEQLFQIANLADQSFAAEFPNMKGPTKANDGHAFTAPVGNFAPNGFGLHDMHGNVFEWCNDWWAPEPNRDLNNRSGPRSGSFKVFRGGSWLSYPWQATAQTRQFISPGLRDYTIGFRVVLEPARQAE
jgi:sulfatase modifying factor 1